MTDDPVSHFRRDIEGLRAVAVLLVLFFHAGLPTSGGYIGVDIFFVISGFLITSLLAREAERTGTISLVGFYAKRARRLLPAASLVLVATVLLVRFLAPITERPVFGFDVVGAAAYFINWRFAERSVDYLAEDLGRSPVLHFWSLSVEEQFYFIWPLIIILALVISRRFRTPLRPTMTVALLLVLLPSFAWSVLFTASNPTQAFFVTSTRLWELSIGAILALNIQHLQALSPSFAAGLGASGLLMLAGSAWLFTAKTVWPGYLALVPTVGAALLIASGSSTRTGTIQRFLGSAPMVWIGGLSYSLYLWHWPVMVVGQDWLKLTGPLWGIALVLIAVLPAWISFRLVETPFRTWKRFQFGPWATLSVGGNLSLLSILAGLILSAAPPTPGATSGSVSVTLKSRKGTVKASPSDAGAGALGRAPTKSEKGLALSSYASITPSLAGAKDDLPESFWRGCQSKTADTSPTWCEIGKRDGTTKVVVVGDSKILQYFEALDAAGNALNWSIRTATKSSCSFVNAFTTSECVRFRDAVLEELRASPPDYLITSQNDSTASPAASEERTRAGMVEGLRKVWSEFVSLGTEVIVVLDNPNPPKSIRPIYECLAKHPDQAERCAFPRAVAVKASAGTVQLEAAKGLSGVHVVDLTDHICPHEQCAPVIGDILIYRQGSHITNTYARTMAPMLTEKLRKIAERTEH